MVRHVLLLEPRAAATPQAIEACRQGILSLVGRIPGLIDAHWGENLAEPARREGFTCGFSMDFQDRASLDAYGPNPDHKPVAVLVRGTFERILVLDFEL
jgi:hypothetical protein